jgi:DNA-binding HxlR family transcriptional regulator
MDDTVPIDLSYVAELYRLFGRQWDAWVLVGLHEGPLRHNDLDRNILALTGAQLDAKALSRSLKRLRDTGLVERVRDGRDWFYRLTQSGAADATQIVGAVADLHRRLDGAIAPEAATATAETATDGIVMSTPPLRARTTRRTPSDVSAHSASPDL